MRSIFTAVAMFSAVATLGAQQLTSVRQLKVPFEAQVVKGAPYWAEVVTESTQTLPDGNRIVQRTTGRIYRDSEGRTRREDDRPGGSANISIVDPPAGTAYSLDPDRRIAWQTPGPAIDALRYKLFDVMKFDDAKTAAAKAAGAGQIKPPAPDANFADESKKKRAAAAGIVDKLVVSVRGAGAGSHELAEEALGPQMVEGVNAVGSRRTTTIPAGAIGNELPIKIVSEEWTSKELGVLVLTRHSDPRSGESSYRLLNIVRSEPARYLFQVPADFTVRQTGVKKFDREQEPR